MDWIKQYITPELAKAIASNRDFRVQLGERYLFYFGLIYFNHYFSHAPAPFHLKMCKDLEFKDHRYLIWLMFRGSAKTAWAKIKLVHNIVYRRHRYNIYACFDKNKAANRTYDVAVELQTNQQIISDFGQLYYDDSIQNKKRSTRKKLDDFICVHPDGDIKVQATSIGVTVQGLNFDSSRPDFWILDDIETWTSVRSSVKTQSTIDWIEGELMGGQDVDTEMLYLCNRLSKFGVIAHLEAKAKNSRDFFIREVAVEEKGKMTWGSRFVGTDEIADKLNGKVKERKKRVISLESEKRNTSLAKFSANFYNTPTNPADSVIKEDWIISNYYDQAPPIEQMDIYIAVDPAAGEKQTADDTAICVVGRHRQTGLIYILEMYNEKLMISDLVDRVIEIFKQWSTAKYVGIEVVYNQRALWQLLDAKKKGDNPVYLPLLPISPRGKDKVVRLEHYQANIRAGTIKFNRYQSAFHDQLIIFPDPREHDDMVDAFIYAVQMATENHISNTSSQLEDDELNKLTTIAGNIMDTKF